MHIVQQEMIKILRQDSIMQYKLVHSYTQETYVLIHISRYSSAFIMLGVRLTKYQQMHSDIQCTAHEMFTFVYTLIGAHIVPLSWRFGYIWCLTCLNLVSVKSGVLFSYASFIFGEFYFGKSKEPCETRIIKFSRKLSILQYLLCIVLLLMCGFDKLLLLCYQYPGLNCLHFVHRILSQGFSPLLRTRLQAPDQNTRPHIKWAVRLLIVHGHFNLPLGFVQVCVFVRTWYLFLLSVFGAL